jgi:hypothetical protein
MIFQQYTYRFLDKTDATALIDLHNGHDKFMGQILTVEQKKKHLEDIESMLYKDQCYVVGAYDNGKLIASTAGKFFDNYPYWYLLGKAMSLNISSLSLAEESWLTFTTMSTMIVGLAESMSIYGFYNRASLVEYRKSEKLHLRMYNKYPNYNADYFENNLIETDGVYKFNTENSFDNVIQSEKVYQTAENSKYDYFIEKAYKANEDCKFLNHKFFFPRHETFDFPCVVTLALLKSKFRKNMLE